MLKKMMKTVAVVAVGAAAGVAAVVAAGAAAAVAAGATVGSPPMRRNLVSPARERGVPVAGALNRGIGHTVRRAPVKRSARRTMMKFQGSRMIDPARVPAAKSTMEVNVRAVRKKLPQLKGAVGMRYLLKIK